MLTVCERGRVRDACIAAAAELERGRFLVMGDEGVVAEVVAGVGALRSEARGVGAGCGTGNPLWVGVVPAGAGG